ncbi:MAG: CPBP family intramembrane glutamic endopeptidase [Chloroflexota bacterium]
MNEYLDLARQGKNDWWRFLLAILSILIAWQVVGAVPTVLLLLWTVFDSNPASSLSLDGTFNGVEVSVSFVAFMLASWAFLAGIFLAVRFIHQRRFLTLVTSSRSLDWKRLFQGFAVWFGLAALVGIAEALLYPGRYVWTLDLPRFLPFVFLALVLIPVQTSAEELFFRAYILQGFGLRLRNIWVLSAISGFLFMLPHLLNPEAKLDYLLMSLYYFSIGSAAAYITLRDGRLELVLGMHAANNLFTALFANATVTVMPTPSLFTVMELDVVYSTVASLFAILIFVLLFVGPLRRKLSTPLSAENTMDSQ